MRHVLEYPALKDDGGQVLAVFPVRSVCNGDTLDVRSLFVRVSAAYLVCSGSVAQGKTALPNPGTQMTVNNLTSPGRNAYLLVAGEAA